MGAPMSARAFPLQWPTGQPRSKTCRSSSYRVKPAAAIDELLESLRLLGATHVVVSANAPLRRDGRPYKDALDDIHADNGVAAYFTLGADQLVVA